MIHARARTLSSSVIPRLSLPLHHCSIKPILHVSMRNAKAKPHTCFLISANAIISSFFLSGGFHGISNFIRANPFFCSSLSPLKTSPPPASLHQDLSNSHKQCTQHGASKTGRAWVSRKGWYLDVCVYMKLFPVTETASVHCLFLVSLGTQGLKVMLERRF